MVKNINLEVKNYSDIFIFMRWLRYWNFDEAIWFILNTQNKSVKEEDFCKENGKSPSDMHVKKLEGNVNCVYTKKKGYHWKWHTSIQ